MIGAAILAIFSAPSIAPALPWASGFSPQGSWAYVADLNGDGYSDLVRVQPSGDAFIDIAINVDGMKCGRPERALSNWGKDCQSAAVGVMDSSRRANVVGVFGGDNLRLARSDKDGRLTDVPNWVKLPVKLRHPHSAIVDSKVWVWDEGTGQGWQVNGEGKLASFGGLRSAVSIQPWSTADSKLNPKVVIELTNRNVVLADIENLARTEILGKVENGQNALVASGKIYVSKPISHLDFVVAFPKSDLPPAPSIWAAGDVDKDGDQDLFQFRLGTEPHTGNDVEMFRTISPGEVDSDHDGLSNQEEEKLGTDPYNPDTDGDGLLDGWEVSGYHGLDLKGMGCDPKKVDLVCLISRYEDVDEKFVKDTFEKVKSYYQSLPVKNPDGSTGWVLHPIFLDKVSGSDMSNPWWANRDKFLPSKWKGLVHWMQIGRGGGGQADELGDGGGCGGGGMALYATFIHEFGHQLGLSHNGFYGADGCPVYPSLMNYPYSYTLNGSIQNIGYSDGRLANVVINESDLDEELPLPYEKVKFLENAPYRFHLKPNGKTTLIDWNWNGVFGEKHVKADINYAYSTTAGRRDDMEKTQVAPWLFTHRGRAYVLFGRDSKVPDTKVDPTLGPKKPGALILKRLKKPYEWEPAQTLEFGGLIGDPVATSYGGKIVMAYQTGQGVVVREADDQHGWLDLSLAEVVDKDSALQPTIGEFEGKLYLFLWNPTTQEVQARVLRGGQTTIQTLSERSTVPVGPAVDTIHHQLILGMAQDRDKTHPSQWLIRRYAIENGKLVAKSLDWVQGPTGDVRTHSRPVVLFDRDKRHGPEGKVYYFTLGDHGKENPWACGYVGETTADKKITGGHVQGGWVVKRFYDEWTQSRSTVGATFYGGDILYAYRWIDGGQGPSDNHLHVGYRGTGIEEAPMGDFDDLKYMREFGIRHSILYLNRN